MQSTLKVKSKTHSGVLPQLRTLEVPVDVSGKVKPGATDTGPRDADQAGFQHGRGEIKPAPQNAERGVTRTFVLSKDRQPLMPCSNARARILISKGLARIYRLFPFTIQLTDRVSGEVQPVAIKFDPGADTTGLAIVREDPSDPTRQTVLHLAEIAHRGQAIRKHMIKRAMFRRRRRNANVRYRAPKFDNRTRRQGWLPPSLQSRVDNVSSWLNCYRKLAPIASIYVESVRFDLQALENPDIKGLEYQRGTLFGAELWEYLLEKWKRRCAYCDAESVPLEAEHIVPKVCGGSNRVSNLTLACRKCNQQKGSQRIEVFLSDDPARLSRILGHTKQPLSSAAAVNATRKAINRVLYRTGLAVQCSTGGRTKFNRTRLGIPKTHALDAACVGEMSQLKGWNISVFSIKATGRGSYQRTRLTKYGFPRGYIPRTKSVKGFRTGDLVKAAVPSGKKAGTYTGRVAVRSSGSFNIQTKTGTVQGISHRHCRRLSAGDGYNYYQTTIKAMHPTAEAVGFLA
jgi:5-methylcytosine-specific restriction endonuclease McrA